MFINHFNPFVASKKRYLCSLNEHSSLLTPREDLCLKAVIYNVQLSQNRCHRHLVTAPHWACKHPECLNIFPRSQFNLETSCFCFFSLMRKQWIPGHFSLPRSQSTKLVKCMVEARGSGASRYCDLYPRQRILQSNQIRQRTSSFAKMSNMALYFKIVICRYVHTQCS